MCLINIATNNTLHYYVFCKIFGVVFYVAFKSASVAPMVNLVTLDTNRL